MNSVTNISSNNGLVPNIEIESLSLIGASKFKEHASISTLPVNSLYRKVFQGTPEMQTQFADFLRTIFYQLDEEKVFALMKDILKDPQKTDATIYEELVTRIGETKKPFSILSMMKALFVVRKGMGVQVASHLEGLEKSSFKNYMEVLNRRYCSSIQKEAGLCFQKTVALCDTVAFGIKDRIEVGSFIYPYQKSLELNDSDCQNPAIEVEKTYKPIGNEIEDKSLDMIALLGGLHHTPEDRMEPFLQSMHKKLKPGSVILLRDHDAGSDEVKAIASVVHSFVNAVDGVFLKQEEAEIRNFQPESYWQNLMERNGFTRIDKQGLILPEDPTQNAMMAFVKAPKRADEVEEAACYQENYLRSKVGSYATWIEWGNVRFSKQYAEFIQTNHAKDFDFTGHIYQHWTHFYHFIKKSLEVPGVDLKDLIFSDKMAMNLMILLGTTAQLGVSALANFPSSCLSKWIYGEKEIQVSNLSTLERFEAKFQDHYSKFIDNDPFYKYPYFQTIKNLWSAVLTSDDSFFTKMSDIVGAVGSTVVLGAQGLLSAFINNMYYSPDSSSDLEKIHVLLDDPMNQIEQAVEEWNLWKMGEKAYDRCEVKAIYQADGRKLLSVPFYKPFTKFAETVAKYSDIKLLKVGGQDKVTLDICLTQLEDNPTLQGAELVYQMDRLQDPMKRRYATYEVAIVKLQEFCKKTKDHIEYIHVPL